MYIVVNRQDYNIGSSHYINKDATYVVINEITNEEKVMTGASLIKRLNKDIKLASFTFKNVNYKCKPLIYWDVSFSKQERLSFDLQTNSVKENTLGLVASITPEYNNSRYIIINSLVITLNKFNLPKYDSALRYNPYRLYIESLDSKEVYINDDSILTDIVLDNIVIKNSIMQFDLKFRILDTVKNNFNDIVYHKSVIDFSHKLLIIDNYKLSLANSSDIAKSKLFRSENIIPEFRFDKESRLSNYYQCTITYDGRVYRSAEAAYQSMKTIDYDLRDRFCNLTPDEAKQLGRKIENSSKLRRDWAVVKYNLMHDIVRAKFIQNEDCKEDLFRTKGFNLVENTTGWCDRVWGKCYCKKCRGTGDNKLGLILTSLRKDFGCDD